jgi:hypothetical protein
MSKEYKAETSSDTIQFVKESVLTISDLTRTKKLTEILNSYAENHSRDVYIVQNSKNKNARAAVVDIDYFQELLQYKEAVDDAVDEIMDEIARQRINDQADINLDEIINSHGLDAMRIIELVDTAEED